jgi:energy-coupling factor transporter transmembrane protein EcfT
LPRAVKIFGIIFIEALFWFVVVFGVGYRLVGEPIYWRFYWGLIIFASGVGALLLAAMVTFADALFCRRLKELHGITNPKVRAFDEMEIKCPQESAAALVKRALERFGAKNIAVSEGGKTITARKGFSFKTSGESITVSIEEIDESSARLGVFSEPRMATSFIDFGQNALNVARIMEIIRSADDSERRQWDKIG